MEKNKTTINPRYSETDQMGIIYHSNYFVWFEVGRTDLLKKHGLGYEKVEEIGIILPVIEVNCKYKSSAFYGDDLDIKTFIEKLTPTRIKFKYEVIRKHDKLLASGFTEHVFVDKNKKRPINLQKSYKDVYEKLKIIYNVYSD